MNKYEHYLGIDVGSVSTNFVIIDSKAEIVHKIYIHTAGKPIEAICKGFAMLKNKFGDELNISAVGATGSGRQLASVLVGADLSKNEITAHSVAATKFVPNVQTIIEIGGQDSKLILIKNGTPYDFAMNTVCAAGTGSFLDRQATRLNIPIEEFGDFAVQSKSAVRIAGRCAVFAESDMIHKQQVGHSNEDIIAGLCEALVRNFLSNLAKGKKINGPIVFQGGVAANIGIVAAFTKALGKEIIVPKYYDVMGAYGVAIIAMENFKISKIPTAFKGLNLLQTDFIPKSFECDGCPNCCEIIQLYSKSSLLANWGDKCGKWNNVSSNVSNNVSSIGASNISSNLSSEVV